MTVLVKKVPPDGGYGWIIMCAYAINNFVSIPIMQGFSLIYKETFEELNFTATEISMILNSCVSFAMLIGIINGPLLKQFGYRKVSIFGATLMTLGVLLTSYATKFEHFMITHGFLTSFGMGVGMSSYSLALNSYFTTKRSKATGLGMTIAGLGPVVMPQLISFLLYLYGVKGAMLIICALVSHSYVSAALLQPVKWHMKDEVIDEENAKLQDENAKSEDEMKNTESEAMMVTDSAMSGSVWSLNDKLEEEKRRKSIENLNDANSKDEKHPLQSEKSDAESKPKDKQSLLKRIIKNIVDIFDLKLLKDPIYINIMFGMSLAIFAEMNFSVLTPFILGDYHLTIPQIATFMSVVSILDLVFRFCAPFIGDLLKQPCRVMYLVSMIMLILTRFCILLTSDYQGLLGVAAALGIAKGFRTVYYSLVIPSYVPIERFAAAAGIQMTVNGIVVLVGGPVIGFIRDISGNYRNCIYVINAVTFSTFVMWSLEMLYVKYRTKPKTDNNMGKT